MSRQFGSDLNGIIRGVQLISSEFAKIQEKRARHVWKNSSLKTALQDGPAKILPSVNPDGKNMQDLMNEAVQRASMITHGIRAFVSVATGGESAQPQYKTNDYLMYDNMILKPDDIEKLLADCYPHSESADLYNSAESLAAFEKAGAAGVNISASININDESLEARMELDMKPMGNIHVDHKEEMLELKPLAIVADGPGSTTTVQDRVPVPSPEKSKVTTMKFKQKLNETAKERKVPSSRIERVISFGSLAAGLGLGTVAEVTRRTLGFNPSVGSTLDSAFLTPANAERIVNTLCKVRGAALKLGQLLSIQDNNVISPVLQQAFERVRQSADFMPRYQIESVLEAELGSDWMNNFKEFDMKPFAAASIGQVHLGQLTDGRMVAVKIQYPGVAEGINSDIDNLISVLNLWNIFPEGMFIDKVVEVAKKELSWEVDYIREGECTKKFKKLLEPYPEYYIPEVIDHLCTKQIFTTQLIEGVPVDKASEFDIETRKHVCLMIMNLCLKELFEFRYMQTDPNWSNFFYNHETRKLILLDFGSSRSYTKEFMDQYIQVIKAAADGDRQRVLDISRDMKFLTGYETKAMEDAHVDAVMILGEVFSEDAGEFDFGKQDTTLRVTKLVPTILNHRLCPPPEEIYSLHRKLSGVFLLCAKLNVQMNCRPLFMDVYKNYV